MNNIIKILLLFVILLSCNIDNRKEEDNRYKIISMLFDKLAQPIDLVFPPPPPDSLNYVFKSKDSIRIDSIIKRVKSERENKKFIVAVHPLFNSYVNGSRKGKDCFGFDETINKLMTVKDSLSVDINKIITKRKDSIIYFKEELILKGKKDYETFDVLISFSHIIFNKTYTKAIITGSVSTSRLAGTTILYFLEKIDNKWTIKCQETLSIS